MADNNAVALVGGHTNPILGTTEVKQVLNDYRDAVQFIHDKTVEGMNKGMTPDELVEYVQLPEGLAGKDYWHLPPKHLPRTKISGPHNLQTISW